MRYLWLFFAVVLLIATANGVSGTVLVNDTAMINSKLEFIRNSGNSDSAVIRAQLIDVFKTSNAIGYQKGIAQSAGQLGVYYQGQFIMAKAREYYSESFQAYRKLGNRKMEANMVNNLGTIDEKMGNYSDAVAEYLYAFEIFDSLDNISGISATANNIGIVYYLMDKPQKALSFFRVGLSMKKQLNDSAAMIYAYQNLGNVFFDLWESDSAVYYYQKCIDLSARGNDALSAGKAYNSLGVIAMIDKKNQEALQLFNKALFYSRKKTDIQNISSVLDNIGLLYLNEEKPQMAIAYFDSSLDVSKSYGLKEEMKNAYQHLSNVYSQQSNYKAAFVNLQNYENLQSELMVEKVNVAGVEAVFIKQKQENKILTLEKEQEKQKTRILLLAGIIIILLISSILGFYVYRIRQDAQLNQKYAELEKARFKAVLEAQEIERKRIAGDLHDSVGQMLSLSKLHLSEIMEISMHHNKEHEQLYQRSIQLIDEACQEVRNISHNLMPGPLIRLGLLAAVKDLIRKINLSGKIIVSLESNLADNRFDEKIEISLYRIIQEIFNNIIKHANATEIGINILQENDKKLELVVIDNGKGFDTSEINQSSGIGWKNIYSRLTIINGLMKVDSVKNSGTNINIQVFL